LWIKEVSNWQSMSVIDEEFLLECLNVDKKLERKIILENV